MIGRDEETKRVTEFPFAQVTTIEIKNLDARFFAVADINPVAINCD